MKFIAMAKRNQVPSDPANAISLLAAARSFVDEACYEGRVDVAYGYLDGSGGFSIFNADSHEEAMDGLLAHPLFAYMDWKVIPVVGFTQAYTKLIDLFEKMGT